LLDFIINRGYTRAFTTRRSFLRQGLPWDQELQTKTDVDCVNPMYEAAFEIALKAGMPTTGDTARMKLRLIDVFHPKNNTGSSQGMPTEQLLGTLDVDFET
jgi:hypothetical protein